MKKIVIVLLILIFLLSAIAELAWSEGSLSLIKEGEFDYSADVTLQSYPSGGFFDGQWGYSLPFWKSEEDHDLYGYLRPSLEYSTGLLHHSFYGQFEIFPVPFIGLYTGGGRTVSFQSEFQGVDCSVTNCRGNYSERYIGTKGGMSYASYFFSFDFYVEKMSNRKKNRNFVEYRMGLVANPRDETMKYGEWVFGMNIDQLYSIGILNVLAKTKKSGNTSDGLFLMGSYQWPVYTGTVLFGNYRGNDRKNHLSILLNVSWIGKRGLGFF